MTTSGLLEKVRRLLQDTESPYHWSDAQLKKDIQIGILSLHKVRPETRYVSGRLVDAVLLPQNDSSVIDVEDRFEEPLVYYAAYLAYSDDCTDPVSKSLADDFLAKFNSLSQL